MDIHEQNKAALAPFLAALYDFDKARARRAAEGLFTPGAPVHMSHPFNRVTGQSALLEAGILPLAQCFPDLERRDTLIIAGRSAIGQNWVGCAGYYLGTFQKPWLTIPPTGQIGTVRFHEFYRFRDGQVVEVQALWDIADLMKQAGCWPMQSSLGREWTAPGPLNGGIPRIGDTPGSLAVVGTMLDALANPSPEVPLQAALAKAWHVNGNWYGPGGIGTARGVTTFLDWPRVPFLNAAPEQAADPECRNLFAEGDLVGFTMDSALSMASAEPAWIRAESPKTPLSIRSLNFWRIENGKIREAWTQIDLLHLYSALGTDILRQPH